jgi:hypothetical protein
VADERQRREEGEQELERIRMELASALNLADQHYSVLQAERGKRDNATELAKQAALRTLEETFEADAEKLNATLERVATDADFWRKRCESMERNRGELEEHVGLLQQSEAEAQRQAASAESRLEATMDDAAQHQKQSARLAIECVGPWIG